MLQSGLYSVDRIEGDIAVLVDSDGTAFDVMLYDLPDGVEERSVLRCENGVFSLDVSAQQQQEDRIKALQNRLRNRK